MLIAAGIIIISHMACERGYFWPFPYLEIKINLIGGVWRGGGGVVKCQTVRNVTFSIKRQHVQIFILRFMVFLNCSVV